MKQWANQMRMLAAASSLCVALQSGCCTPMVVSHRFIDVADSVEIDPVDQAIAAESSCDCPSVVGHFFHYAARPHRLLPGSHRDSHGLLAHGGSGADIAPHSKFHPVPTRPVFESRDPGTFYSEFMPQLDVKEMRPPVPEPELVAPGPDDTATQSKVE